jgi:hypothetical protein
LDIPLEPPLGRIDDDDDISASERSRMEVVDLRNQVVEGGAQEQEERTGERRVQQMGCSAVEKRSWKEEGKLVVDALEDGALCREAGDSTGEHAGVHLHVARVAANHNDTTQRWQRELTEETPVVNNWPAPRG